MRNAPLLVISGQTAAGKTQVALELAQQRNGEIVNADSVQIYQEFNIGSAKPSASELAQAPHHLFSILQPNQKIDAATFAKQADRTIDAIHARGRLPIVVGGTGLWIRALLRGLVALPPADASFRASLRKEASRCGWAQIHKRLQGKDPESAHKIHPNDGVRIERALEVFAKTGQKLSSLHAEHSQGSPRYDHTHISLFAAPETLRERIRLRTKDMLERGFVEEVINIRQRWGSACWALSSVGYAQCQDHLEGRIAYDDLEVAIARATWKYARRQKNWFQSERGVKAFFRANQAVDTKEIARQILSIGDNFLG